jgi:hypothetical protein
MSGMTNNDSGSANSGSWRPAQHLRLWMQVVGAFYLAQFVMMAIVRAPIRTFGPEGALAEADAGDPLARFLVDTWTTFGLEVAAVGVTLLIATRRRELAKGAVWKLVLTGPLSASTRRPSCSLRRQAAARSTWVPSATCWRPPKPHPLDCPEHGLPGSAIAKSKCFASSLAVAPTRTWPEPSASQPRRCSTTWRTSTPRSG